MHKINYFEPQESGGKLLLVSSDDYKTESEARNVFTHAVILSTNNSMKCKIQWIHDGNHLGHFEIKGTEDK